MRTERRVQERQITSHRGAPRSPTPAPGACRLMGTVPRSMTRANSRSKI